MNKICTDIRSTRGSPTLKWDAVAGHGIWTIFHGEPWNLANCITELCKICRRKLRAHIYDAHIVKIGPPERAVHEPKNKVNKKEKVY